LSSDVASHHSAVVPQSSEKGQIYNIIYNMTLNPNCGAEYIKILKKKSGKWVRSQN
jgi:hypothetical protein